MQYFNIAGDEDGDDEEEGGEEVMPSCFDYVMHFLTIFWKVLFAFVPPTGLIHLILTLLTTLYTAVSINTNNGREVTSYNSEFVIFSQNKELSSESQK